MLEGWVSPDTLAKIRSGLPAEWPASSRALWASFAYADIPLGREYGIVFPRERPQDGIPCRCRIIAATQQFGRPFEIILRGWKSVCLVDFPEGPCGLLERLPTLDGWSGSPEWLGLCDELTWERLKSA